MSGHSKRPRVLLATLSVRTSGKGNAYLAGWLGKAKVVAFAGEPDLGCVPRRARAAADRRGSAMKRDLARLLEAARRDGWRVERTRKSHWRLQHPSGAVVVTGSSPSCPRALLNLRADLRRTERRAP